MQNGTATLENSLSILMKLNIDLPYDLESASTYSPKRNENGHPHKDSNVHNCFLHNSLKTRNTLLVVNS